MANEQAARILQDAVDTAVELARRAQKGAPMSELDDLAGKVVQKMGAFRNSLRVGVVHFRAVMEEMDYDGPACLQPADKSTKVTEDEQAVTCDKCARHTPQARRNDEEQPA